MLRLLLEDVSDDDDFEEEDEDVSDDFEDDEDVSDEEDVSDDESSRRRFVAIGCLLFLVLQSRRSSRNDDDACKSFSFRGRRTRFDDGRLFMPTKTTLRTTTTTG